MSWFWHIRTSLRGIWWYEWIITKHIFFRISVLSEKSQVKLTLSQLQWRGYHCTGIILCIHPANVRRCYNVKSSLIGWEHTQNYPHCTMVSCLHVCHCQIVIFFCHNLSIMMSLVNMGVTYLLVSYFLKTCKIKSCHCVGFTTNLVQTVWIIDKR